MVFRWSAIGLALSVLASPAASGADDRTTGPRPLPLRRYEFAGFPILGGSSDIGFQFGAAGTLTRFYDGSLPYAWNIDFLVSASIKDVANRLALAQQSHVLRLDVPDLFSGRLRMDTRASFQRTINMGYYGLGNAATAEPTRHSSQYYQYLQEEGRVRSITRARTPLPRLDLAFGANLRYESPSVYDSSRLAADTTRGVGAGAGGDPSVVGTRPVFIAGGSAGLMYDTRDSEFVTRSGIFYQVGVGGTLGAAEQIGYGEVATTLAHYAPIGGPLVFASRFVASLQFGRVPFYDLAQAGTFEPQYLLGGDNGVRGVPMGRYAGHVKLATNLEIRATPFPRFIILGERLRIGTTVFLDAGRVWSDHTVIGPADGSSISLKYGIGAGVFLQWGEAAIFRIEAAYSPDAVSENPRLPLGIYVSDGLMF